MTGKGVSPYGPSKAGHEALVSTMAKDLEGTGVTANPLQRAAETASPRAITTAICALP